MVKLFFFCLGLFLASTFCMKVIERDITRKAPALSVMKLELTYSRQETTELLLAADPVQKDKLRYVLLFDFVFMAGCFPGIALLCLFVRKKYQSRGFRFALLVLAVLQLASWVLDIYENRSLLQWLQEPGSVQRFGLYRFIVQLKWILALAGVAVILAGSAGLLFRKKAV